MDHKRVLTEINEKYPGRKIIKLPEDNPTEILCEIEPTEDHPEYSVAISVIDKSLPHYHKQVVETYEVIRGELTVFIDGVEHKLGEGEKLEVRPGQKHYAVGNETWIMCTAKPGWTVEDHIMEDSNKARE